MERSYYAATANAFAPAPKLEGEARADVVVIGGGYTGLHTALNAIERGYSVILLEADRIGWGASGRSGGQAIVGYSCPQSTLVAAVGREDARRMFDISVEAQELIRALVAKHGIDCDLHWGHLHTALKPR